MDDFVGDAGNGDGRHRASFEMADIRLFATLVSETCGYGSVLDCGCGDHRLVAELLAQGFDAWGIETNEGAVKLANEHFSGRFLSGSILAIPFPDARFDVVVSVCNLERLAEVDIPSALRELARVSARYVFLRVPASAKIGQRAAGRGREWLEARCFQAGFRKHPLYYDINPYERLNDEQQDILILLEKVPAHALEQYDLTTLVEERLLHTDMLRESGRRSDAHCIRYHKAAEYIRPGDHVLDVACGLGYGSHILYAASQAKSVLGIDLSDFSIAYANEHYRRQGAVEFRVGDAQTLDSVPDASVDFIAGFETIEHVPDPKAYLASLKRVLKPSGRMLVSAPNDWTDETGKDPNPHHLHVYTWDRLVTECGDFFLLEQGFLQTAGGAMKCHHSPRKWGPVPVDVAPSEEAEWVLVLAMADPVAGKDLAYEETTWRLPASPDFNVSAFARDYDNPWLVKGMVAIGMRARSARLLASLQERVLGSARPESVDYGAALCGRVYALLGQSMSDDLRRDVEAEILRYAAIPNPTPHQLRWQVSVLFAGGELARVQGRTDAAVSFYAACADRDVEAYSPLLGNRTLDALYWQAVIALGRRDEITARKLLLRSVAEVSRLVRGSWLNIVGDFEAPLPFGLAEISQLLEKGTRAAYMLSTLDSVAGRGGRLRREAAGFLERQITDRDRRLADLEANVQRLAKEVIAQDAHAQGLAREVIARDAKIQALTRQIDGPSALAVSEANIRRLAKEIIEKDVPVDGLAQELIVRNITIQALMSEIGELRATADLQTNVQRLAQEVIALDGHVEGLARELTARDATIQALTGEIGKLSAQLQRAYEGPIREICRLRKKISLKIRLRLRPWIAKIRSLFSRDGL